LKLQFLPSKRRSFDRKSDGLLVRLDPTGPIAAAIGLDRQAEAEQSVKEALEFAEGIIATIPDILFEMDRTGRYLQVWTKNPEMLAATKQHLLGKTVNEILPPEAAALALEVIREADENGSSDGRTIQIAQHNGEIRWFEHFVAKRKNSRSSTPTFLVLSRDITTRKRAEDVVEEARSRLLVVLQAIPDHVWLKDMDGVYMLCNHAFELLVGRSEAEIIGKTDLDLFGADMARFYREHDKAVAAAGRLHINEEWSTDQETGKRRLVEIRKLPVLDGAGQTIGVLGVGRDITELNASRDEIHRMAFYDPLTSLPNRTLFYDRLKEMIAEAVGSGQLTGIMLIDLDNFKAVNDTMGHPAGDALLSEATRRIQASVGSEDFVARLGGDEFAILMPNIRHQDDVNRIVGRIVATFDEPFVLEGKEIFASCSIGTALSPIDSSDANDLMKYADSAMYFAKRSGRGKFHPYSKELTETASERLMLASNLRRASERGELQLYYQPKVQLGSERITGSEALLRWNHPQLGFIPPTQFIPVAEETGLIVEIGEWVLREACRTAAELNASGSTVHKIAVNLSPRQFQSPDLTARIAQILEETGCRPEWIEAEITESLLLDQKAEILETLTAIRAMGISIAIDDFGTGYSALSYLAHYPIDTLKIDRSFIISTDKRSGELVKAILSIARCLGQKVVAEGVETAEQAAFLTENGCDSAQGYLYSRPVPKAEFMGLLG
jgi:diguanylate cyclase (GGDEF)-like protein/PAS domain S-box-containing protein